MDQSTQLMAFTSKKYLAPSGIQFKSERTYSSSDVLEREDVHSWSNEGGEKKEWHVKETISIIRNSIQIKGNILLFRYLGSILIFLNFKSEVPSES